MNEFLQWTVGVIAVASYGIAAYLWGRKHGRILQLMDNQKTLKEFGDEAMWWQANYRKLESSIDEQVEVHFIRRLSEYDWEHKIRQDVDHAVYMAAKRDQLNAGRTHPPRADGGPSATVSRLRIPRKSQR